MEFLKKALIILQAFLIYMDNIYTNFNFIIFWRKYNAFCILFMDLLTAPY
jgi:hypothetical protein